MNASLHQIRIPQDLSIFVQAGSMAAFGNASMKTETLTNNIFSSISNSFFGGEWLFHNRFIADQGRDGWVALNGDLDVIECELAPQESLTVKRGALIARDSAITLSTETQGFSGFFSGMGIVTQTLINTSSKVKRVWLETPKGSLKELKINRNSGSVYVDSRNLVGYTSGLHTENEILGGLLNCCTARETSVNSFEGRGSVFLKVGGEHVKSQPSMER
jgi:uncharacterized protein (AIM24 family)